ncbi:deoxyribodipyrimidine photo-lyase [Rhodosalinus sp. FB01]|uniref:cryptochrome/photolyase family protein n=1 Tax=Rhodosalinus sp. FB01 TaxID=3239194 RepID=UPI003525D1E5
MSDNAPIILWFRRDLRMADHPALHAAVSSRRPVIPVFLRDDLVDRLGAAPKFRLGLGLERFAAELQDAGSRLVLRAGAALPVLRALAAETGAAAVWWTRAYDADSVARDKEVKAALREDGMEARSFGGHLMFEPWTVETGQGSFYKVYTPFWRAVSGRDVDAPHPAPGRVPAPDAWPESESLSDWELGRAMRRGAEVVARFARVGEAAARDRLEQFMDGIVAGYDDSRDLPAEDGTSALSENLSLGEISPHQCWHAAIRAREEGKPGAETFMKELVWREFAYHLLHHTPRLATSNWREEWDAFPWNKDEDDPRVTAWRRGRTGIPFVDAGQREMYVTGRMHNRARMVVASYLTKHLLTHWKIGMRWFEEHLIDWDPASNAMGWQWSAGSGPDATPYFRVFNPLTQAKRFDPDGAYLRRWIAEGQDDPPADALAYFDAVPRSWALSPDDDYPDPVVDASEGRKIALEAYENKDF